MDCTPDCEREPGHDVPCGRIHVPGSPCEFCDKPTPLDGGPCPDCWVSLVELPMADIKAVFARGGIDLGVPYRGERRHGP